MALKVGGFAAVSAMHDNADQSDWAGDDNDDDDDDDDDDESRNSSPTPAAKTESPWRVDITSHCPGMRRLRPQ